MIDALSDVLHQALPLVLIFGSVALMVHIRERRSSAARTSQRRNLPAGTAGQKVRAAEHPARRRVDPSLRGGSTLPLREHRTPHSRHVRIVKRTEVEQ